MGCVIFNTSQYGNYLSPYKYLTCIQLPPIHEKVLQNLGSRLVLWQKVVLLKF
jgi:hypothetical protein